MKINIILSILFVVVSTFASIHEVEHIIHDDASTCLVCHVNNNLASADIIKTPCCSEAVHFDKITFDTFISPLHITEKNNQNRAPPSFV